MEETTTTEHHQESHHHGDLALTTEAQFYLNEGAGWGKFLGILGFILSGLMLIFALFAGAFLTHMQQLSPYPNPNPMANMGAFLGVIFGLIALVYFFPALYIYRFGTKAKKGLQFGDKEDITASMSNLKSVLKFWGILMIIALIFMLLRLIGIFVGLGMSGAMH